MTTTPDSPSPSTHSDPATPEVASAGASAQPESEKSTETPAEDEHSHEPSSSESASEPAEDKGKATQDTSKPAADDAGPSSTASTAGTASAGDWQAIWSPGHNAYYFYNSVTQETTWENPLQPTPAASASTSASASVPASGAASPPAEAGPSAATQALYALQAAAAAQGIDPSLAHLDPSLAGPSGSPAAFTYTAKFNARTGAFTRPDGRDPTHLSEYERAKRMSMAYFDVGQWEQDVETRHKEEEEEEGKKRKRPTKKDLVSHLRLRIANMVIDLRLGEVQRAEKAEKDCKDGLVAYIDDSYRSYNTNVMNNACHTSQSNLHRLSSCYH